MTYKDEIKSADLGAAKVKLFKHFIDNSFGGYLYSLFDGPNFSAKGRSEYHSSRSSYYDTSSKQHMYSREYRESADQTYEKICKKQVAIRDLSTFEALLCLSVDQHASTITEDVAETIKVAFNCENGALERLLKITSYIIGMTVAKNKGTDVSKVQKFAGLDFNKIFIDSNTGSIVDLLRSLMNSIILKDNNYAFLKGPLLNLLKCWIDKAGYTGIIHKLEARDEIPKMCAALLNETYTLNEFWNFDFRNNTSFFQLIKEEYMIGFPQLAIDMCYICYHLLGNKESNHSNNLMKMLSNFDTFVAKFDESYLETILRDDEDGYNSKFKRDYESILKIPEGTRAKRFEKHREWHQVKLNYDAWPLLIEKWAHVIECSEDKSSSKSYFRDYRELLEWICRFISKLLILDPTKIEDITVSYEDACFVSANLERVVNLLLKSLEQLKIMLIALKEDDDVVKSTLEAIGSIVSAISNLYRQPSYRKVVVEVLSNFDVPYSNMYPGYGSSGSNKLNHILKELNNMEHSIGEYPITKAATQLGCAILNDSYPSFYLMSLVGNIKDMKFKSNKDSLEIQVNLLEMYKQALLKFKTSMTKSNVELKNLQGDSFFALLKDFINDADIEKLLEDTLELEYNASMEIDTQSFHSVSNRLDRVNKLYNSFHEEMGTEDWKNLKNLLATSLECMQVILDLIFTQITMEKDKDLKAKSTFLHQHHIDRLICVKYIKDALLSSLSFMSDLADNKLVITIASYVRFEHRYLCPVNNRESPFDGSLNSTVSFEKCHNVSSIALKCLTEIVRIWELYPVSKRPSLASYLTSSNNAFAGAHQLISGALVNTEETACFLEFLICCTNSQIGFVNTLFKDAEFYKAITDTFCKNFSKLAERIPMDKLIKKIIGLNIVFISNFIQTQKFKNNKEASDMITQFLQTYLSNGRDTTFALFVYKPEFNQADFEMSSRGFDSRKMRDKTFMLQEDDFLEQKVKDVCFYNHVVSSFLLMISNLLVSISIGKDKDIKTLTLNGLRNIYGDRLCDILKI